MGNRMRAYLLATLVAAVASASGAGAADLNGPMSSSKPPEASSGASQAAPAADSNGGAFDAQKLFANTCGWCHSDAGRVAGKGPKLMGTTLTDAEIVHRIKVGKPGAMPAFDGAFKDDEIQAIVKYIRGLKEDGAPK